MSENEFRWCENNRRNLMERLFMQQRQRAQERYVVRPDGEGLSPRPDIRVTARHRCRAVRQAMRTRLVQQLLRRLGLPVGLMVGMLCGSEPGSEGAEAKQITGTATVSRVR